MLMDIEKIAQKAREMKVSGRYNCAQAVMIALKEETDLSEGVLMNIGAGFCAGMGTKEATCGALIGAGIISGLKTKGQLTLKYNKELLEEFRSLCGATVCKDLKALTDGKPLCPCDMCVYNAVIAYGKILNK